MSDELDNIIEELRLIQEELEDVTQTMDSLISRAAELQFKLNSEEV